MKNWKWNHLNNNINKKKEGTIEKEPENIWRRPQPRHTPPKKRRHKTKQNKTKMKKKDKKQY